MTTRHVSFVEANRLHGVFNLRQTFNPSINIMYGPNGVGKTTLLHLLANVLAGDYEQFAYLQFATITVGLSDDTTLTLKRTRHDDDTILVEVLVNDERIGGYRWEIRRAEDRPNRVFPSRRLRDTEPKPLPPVFSVSYFPAFRSMLDAWVSAIREGLVRSYQSNRTPTDFARKLFGPFIPQLTYPSLIDIEKKLREEVGSAFRLVSEAETSQIGLAAEAVFQGILSSPSPVERPAAELVRAIGSFCNRIKRVSSILGRKEGTDLSRLAGLVSHPEGVSDLPMHAQAILEVYERSLERVAMAQEEAVETLAEYLKTINSFFSMGGKHLVIASDGDVRVRHDEGGRELSLHTLSSGERHIVAMVYEATHMSGTEVVLIDEPELSLHVDWQRPLLTRMAEQMGEKQIIVATHSPVIGADIDGLQELNLTYAKDPLPDEDLVTMGAETRIVAVRFEERLS